MTELLPRPRGTRVPWGPRPSIGPLLLAALISVAVIILILPAIQLSSGGTIRQWSVAQLQQEAQAGNVRSLAIKGDTGVAVDRAGGTWRVALGSDASRVAALLSTEGVNTTRENDPFAWVPRNAPVIAAISFGWLWSAALVLVLGVVLWFAFRRGARLRL